VLVLGFGKPCRLCEVFGCGRVPTFGERGAFLKIFKEWPAWWRSRSWQRRGRTDGRFSAL